MTPQRPVHLYRWTEELGKSLALCGAPIPALSTPNKPWVTCPVCKEMMEKRDER